MKNEKLIIPAAIIIAALILSIGYFAVQVQKQNSIERQQRIELEQEKADKAAQREQEQKEYVVKRKKDCYELEQSERKKYNNVDGSFYDEENDVCKVRYENKNWREGDPFLSGWNEETQKYEEGKYFTNEF
ncbi:MAG: hypothetical protein GF365_00940 [Candidatus Buchananbacteria bacterium]|nr:hypothetical protein [Candidatus Buchananbacteria bacterium]